MTKISVPNDVVWEATDWTRLKALGEVSYHPGFPADDADLLLRIGGAEIIAGADVALPAPVIAGSPRLRMISLWSTGYNHVDLEAAHRAGVVVCNVPGYSAFSVAEHAWAMVLHLTKRLGEADAHVRSGRFDWSAIRGIELHGKTVGIIGTGAIGAHSATIARGLGCRVLAYTRHPSATREEQLGVTYVSWSELLAESDVILLHVALTPETRHLVDDRGFAMMKKRPILVNTSRGAVIDPAAALRALEGGRLGGLGLDVMWQEPPDWEQADVRRLLASTSVVLSPHCAAHTAEALQRLTRICLDNVEAFLKGEPINILP